MSVEDTIHIEAPPAVVWAVTEDVERWPEWTPTVASVTRVDDGPFGLGSAALIKQPALPLARWTVTAFARGERFAWETRVRGLRLIGSHELIPAGAGTQSRLRVEASGLTAVLLWPLLRPAMRRALAQENAGLRARCEAREARQGPQPARAPG
jgi:uncharacterized membrane protein